MGQVLQDNPGRLQVIMQEDPWLQNCGIRRRLQDLLHVRDRHQESVQGQLRVVKDVEGLRRLWCPQGHHEESAHFARHLPEVRRRRRPDLHGLQHQVLLDIPGRLQVNMQEDRRLQNCGILDRRHLLHVRDCHQERVQGQLRVVKDVEGLRGLWCPQEGGHFARHLPEVRRRPGPICMGYNIRCFKTTLTGCKAECKKTKKTKGCKIAEYAASSRTCCTSAIATKKTCRGSFVSSKTWKGYVVC